MPVTPPTLDDRALKDILEQLQSLAVVAVPEWKPPPDGDAGTMLQRLYARLMELALERLNQVPEKNLPAFLDTMGVSLLPASPARVPLTFALTPGAGPTLVPHGTPAGTKPSSRQPAVIFETDDDLTVIPARLTMGFTIDPQWDRYMDVTPALSGESLYGFTPFVGTKPNRHALYLGAQQTFLLSQPSRLRLIFGLTGGLNASSFIEFIQSLRWEYRSGGQWLSVPIPPFVWTASQSSTVLFLQFDHVSALEDQTLAGGGLDKPLSARWIRATLPAPIGEFSLAPKFRFSLVGADVQTAILPDDGYANRHPPSGSLGEHIDFQAYKAIQPFGNGALNKEFWLACPEGLEGYEELEIWFELATPGIPVGALIRWEHWKKPSPNDPAVWDSDISVQDTTGGLSQNGFVRLRQLQTFAQQDKPAPDVALGRWIRARIFQGSYSQPPVLRSVHFQRAGLPDKAFVNTAPADISKGVFPFGEKPKRHDTFYIASEEAFSKSTVQVTLYVRLSDSVFPPTGPGIGNPIVVWEYPSVKGWQAIPNVSDTTSNLTNKSGVVQFFLPSDRIPSDVNGQVGHWIRARLVSGNYGVEARFTPVNAQDPSQGFIQQANTGVFTPPLINSLRTAYRAVGLVQTVAENAFALTVIRAQPGGAVPAVFRAAEEPEPTFYLGFDAAFPEKPVSLYIATPPRAAAGSVIRDVRAAPPASPPRGPLHWEYFNGTKWRDLIVFDQTNSLTESGTVQFLTPTDIAPSAKFDATPRYWIRARSPKHDPPDTQRVLGIFLNTVPATQALTVAGETLGSSNGQPNQTFRLTQTPVLPGQQILVREPEPPSDKEREEIEQQEGTDAITQRINPTTGEKETWVRWHEMPNFLQSDAHSRHYTLDHIRGVLTFGAMIPPRGTNNITATYRAGGGAAGNAPKGAVAQIKSPVAGLAKVTNPVAAGGGAATETAAMVRERGPQTLRHRDRAVAAADLEWLARQAAGTSVARARCLPNINRHLRFEPGWATLIIVPQGTDAKLSPNSELIRQVEDALEARAVVGLTKQIPTRLNVVGPGYLQVVVAAQIVPRDIDEAEQVKQRALAALTSFFHPLTGGPKGTGWIFGRDVYVSEVCKVLEDVPGVSHVTTCELIAHIAQHRLALTAAFAATLGLPEDSAVVTANRAKAARLAEPVLMGATVERIAIKGFKEGDRITKARDLIVSAPSNFKTVQVQSFNSDAVGFPRGCIVSTFDGARRTRLAAGIPRDKTGLTQITVEDASFAAQLKSGDVLTVFYPFPMTIQSVELETIDVSGNATPVQTLGVEPYETDVAFPAGSILTTLDNVARMPLAVSGPAGRSVTSLSVLDFAPNESLVIARRDGLFQTPLLTIKAVQPVTDIVYLDDNFLVYSGSHQIVMVAE